MEVYFIRHGASVDRLSGNYQSDSSMLSKRGEKEARLVAERCASLAADRIFTSSLKRAEQTARIIKETTGLPITVKEDLKEIERPTAVRGKSKDDQQARYIAQTANEYFADSDHCYSDEENFWTVKDRSQRVLRYLATCSEESVLVVTHGGLLRMILGLVMIGREIDPKQFHKIFFTTALFNTGLCKFKYNNGKWVLISWNDHDHLK